MVIDFIILTIILISAAAGCRRGLVRSIFMFTGWLLASIGAVFLTPHVQKILGKYTTIKAAMDGRFRANLEEGLMSPTGMIQDLPLFMQEKCSDLTGEFIDLATDNLVGIGYTVMCFALTMLLIRIAISIVIAMFSKTRKRPGSVIHRADGFLGLLFGFAFGVLAVFALLALYPLGMTLLKPEQLIKITEMLNLSYLAGLLYDHNFLLMLLYRG